jgi:hypothetical protein
MARATILPDLGYRNERTEQPAGGSGTLPAVAEGDHGDRGRVILKEPAVPRAD